MLGLQGGVQQRVHFPLLLADHPPIQPGADHPLGQALVKTTKAPAHLGDGTSVPADFQLGNEGLLFRLRFGQSQLQRGPTGPGGMLLRTWLPLFVWLNYLGNVR